MPKIEPKYEMMSFQKLFGPDNIYEVPSYQRGYAWGTEQVEQLLDDVQKAHEQDAEGYYLLGQSIVCRNGRRWDVVDGQQRLTTLFILVTHARNVLEDASQDFQRLQKSRFSGILALVQREIDGKLEPSLFAAEAGRNYIKLLVDGLPFPDEPQNPSQAQVQNTHEYFTEWLDRNYSTPLEKFEFLWYLITRVLILRLELTDLTEALIVFQRMNSRGLDLDDADLLKNLLFIKADDSTFDSLSKSWDKAAQSLFSARLKRAKSMEFLLKALIGIKTGESIPTSALFKEWAKFLVDADSVFKFATALNDKAVMLARASNGRNFSNEKVPQAPGTYLFKWVQHLEVLLAGSHLEDSSYKLLAQIVDDRAMLSMLAGEKNQNLERDLHKWAREISGLKSDSDRNEIIAASSGVLSNLPTLFNQLRTEVASYSYEVKTQREKLRYALARVAA
jgi:hypothetical protein